MMLKHIVLVGLGGCFGSISRFLLGLWVNKFPYFTDFPIGTLLVNVIGCYIIGFLGGLAQHHHIISAELRLLLMVGFLGGFTTFSSFGYESCYLALNSEFLKFSLNIILSIILGLAGVILGGLTAKAI